MIAITEHMDGLTSATMLNNKGFDWKKCKRGKGMPCRKKRKKATFLMRSGRSLSRSTSMVSHPKLLRCSNFTHKTLKVRTRRIKKVRKRNDVMYILILPFYHILHTLYPSPYLPPHETLTVTHPYAQ